MATLAKYQILEKIGVGGFGVVYKAHDPFIKRNVAIKTCSAADPETRERFVREAEIAGNLHHRNIVTVYDFGFEGETPYLVQEYLGGEDLDRKIKRREFIPLPAKVLYLVQIARGLQYAHARGVIHRDIKPGNIRILDDDTAKIMDFGIARLARQQQPVTQAGVTLGTAAYLAPEQIRGEPVDARTDIFSFGVLAYELLSFERPFHGAEISAVFFQILNEPPAPLVSRAPECPAELARIVERCLAKDPAQRYLASNDLLHDLEELAHRRRIGDGGLAAQRAASAPTAPLPTSGRATESRPLSVGDIELDGAHRHFHAAAASQPPSGLAPRRGRRWATATLTLAALISAGAWGWWRYRQETTPIPYPAAASREAAPAPVAPAPAAASSIPATAPPSGAASSPATAPPAAHLAAPPAAAAESAPPPAAAAEPAPPPPPPPPKPAKLVLEPGWDSTMTVRVAGRTLTLDQMRRLELAPGSYRLRFALESPQYSREEELAIRLGAGESRTVISPIQRPGKLTIQPHLETRQGFVRIDGGPPVATPVRGRWLAPGPHRVEIAAGPDPAAAALVAETIDVESNFESIFTFDLDGRREAKRTARALLPN